MNLAHNLHSEWLTEQLRDSENKLADAQNTISETKQNIAYLKKMLKFINSDNTEARVENNNVNVLDEHNDNDISSSEESKRTPKQMLLPEYADMSLGDAIYTFLVKTQKEVSLDDIAQEVFDVQTEDEFQRVKSSSSAELRRNQDNGKWHKTGRGCWQVTSSENVSDAPILDAIERANGVVEPTGLTLVAPWT